MTIWEKINQNFKSLETKIFPSQTKSADLFMELLSMPHKEEDFSIVCRQTTEKWAQKAHLKKINRLRRIGFDGVKQ